MFTPTTRVLALAACLLAPPLARAQPADVADVPTLDLRAGKDDHKRFFLYGPMKDAKAPEEGLGLVLLLPGGSGSADFQAFGQRLYKALPPGYVMAQLVAVKWDREQEIVWPTARDKVKGAKFTTEKFVAAVLDEVKARHKVDPRRVYTLSWSSGGPAAYAVALSVPQVKGSFVAMSVYRPDRLPPLKAAKGHAFFLYHSPEDRVCPAWMARRAQRELTANGARVTLLTYPGGHGWFGDWRIDVRSGIAWLDRPAKKKE